MTVRRWSIAAGAALIAAGLALWLAMPAQDLALYRALHIGASARSLPWLVRLTDVGGAAIMIPFALLVSAWLAIRRHYPQAVWLLATITSGRIVIELAKALFARDRPAIADRLVSVTSASFPSSHSAGTMLTCVALCLALRARLPAWALAATFTCAIGFTRVALGVHWPSDVLAGWGIGLVWVAALSYLAPVTPPASAGHGPHSAHDDKVTSPLDRP